MIRHPLRLLLLGMLLSLTGDLFAQSPSEVLDIWPDLAPGETTKELGQPQPARPEDGPLPVTRLVNISRPTLAVYPAENPSGSAVIILPGGGFAKVVPDKEGSEAVQWLGPLGITVFVLNYRTINQPEHVGWERALQDAQRAMKVVRGRAQQWKLDPQRLGLIGFSAGGQVAARLLADKGKLAYASIDELDSTQHRPNFALLVYPWNIYDTERDGLIDGLEVPADCPPTFLVHTHDDRSTALGAVAWYAGLKKQDIAAELHVYGNGGHGYGMRAVPGSQIDSWVDHAAHWIGTQGF